MRNAERTMRSRRGGASILEVLFAILVTTIGLLGAVAVFPVAGSYARKARLADMMAAGGRSAVHAFDTRGMRRANERWMDWNATNSRYERFTSVPATDSFCIDPRFIATNSGAQRFFPYSATTQPAMRRITLWSGQNNAAGVPRRMDQQQADLIFSVDDDLTFVRPGVDDMEAVGIANDDSLPGAQLFTEIATASGVQSGKRQAGGEFSWLATLVPKADLHSLTAGSNDLYVLSIVMFHQRPMVDLALDAVGAPATYSDMYEYSERVINSSFFDVTGTIPIGDGVGGGTVRLQLNSGPTRPAFDGSLDEAKKYLRVRPGDWILLAGQEVIGTTPVNRFHWYRVSSCDSEPTSLGDINADTLNDYELYVSLIGGDWNVNLSSQRAIIVEGVIGVYEKTIRLETGGSM